MEYNIVEKIKILWTLILIIIKTSFVLVLFIIIAYLYRAQNIITNTLAIPLGPRVFVRFDTRDRGSSMEDDFCRIFHSFRALNKKKTCRWRCRWSAYFTVLYNKNEKILSQCLCSKCSGSTIRYTQESRPCNDVLLMII